jgi:hypothetical protein
MSTLAYGAITRKREEAAQDTSTTTEAPALKTYVDALAALVPAEILGLHAFILQGTTETKTVKGQSVTTITDPQTLRWTFWVLIVLSIVLYLGAHQRANWDGLDILRAAIPPVAFVLWLIMQKTSAFDAIWPHAFAGHDGARLAIGAIGAVALGILAGRLGVAADEKPAAAAKQPAPATGSKPVADGG